MSYRIENSLPGTGKHEIVFQDGDTAETIGEIDDEFGKKLRKCQEGVFKKQYSCWGLVQYVLNPDRKEPFVPDTHKGITQQFYGGYSTQPNEIDPSKPQVVVYSEVEGAMPYDHAMHSGNFDNRIKEKESVPQLKLSNGNVVTSMVRNIHEAILIAIHDGSPVIAEKQGNTGNFEITNKLLSPYSSPSIVFDALELLRLTRTHPYLLKNSPLRCNFETGEGIMTQDAYEALVSDKRLQEFFPLSEEFWNKSTLIHNKPMYVTFDEYQTVFESEKAFDKLMKRIPQGD